MRSSAVVAMSCLLTVPRLVLAGADLAEVTPAAESVSARPRDGDLALALAVSGPRGVVLGAVGEPGREVRVSLVDAGGQRLGDGDYHYEARPAGLGPDDARATDVVSGSFRVRHRQLEPASGRHGPAGGSGDRPLPPQPDDQVIADDLVVQGGLCAASNLCVNGESFFLADLKLKRDSTPALLFEDDDAAGPTADWRLITGIGGVENFALDQIQGPSSTTPFRIDGGAPTNALRVNSVGRVGLGTATPLGRLHVTSPTETANLILQTSTSHWQLFNDNNGIGLSRLSGAGAFYLHNNAPGESFVVHPTGNVGMGPLFPATPAAALHLYRTNGSARLRVEEGSPSAAERVLFHLRNAGKTRFLIENTASGDLWTFDNNGPPGFSISKVGTGVNELLLGPTGNLTIQGTLTQLSDRDAKRDVEQVDGGAVLERLAALPVSTWTYKADQAGARHIGPMAQDFAQAFGLGTDDKHVAPSDVAGVGLAAVQALKRLLDENAEEQRMRLEEKDAQIRELSGRLAALEARAQSAGR